MERIDPACAFSLPWATLQQQTGEICEGAQNFTEVLPKTRSSAT